MSVATLAMMLMVSVHICHGKISVTYAFPSDSCVSDPYLVDEDTMVIMKFEGDIGSQECRQISFTTQKSAFYSYTICMKELYYSSPKCQSKVYFRWYWSYYDYDYDDTYDYNSKEISGVGCSYHTNRLFSRCLYESSHVSFELRKSQKVVPDILNDTFKFQIETKWDFNYETIGGISGGIVGMCIFTGVGIYLCINCRRRKRATGRYCCTCPTYVLSCSKSMNMMKEGISQGFSAEIAAAGILVCSCVICRRQNCKQQDQDQCEKVTMETNCYSTESENKWKPVTGETITGFKDQDTAPLCGI